MGIRTPLAKAKGTGSAKEGAHHWWAQRLSGIALIVLVLWTVCLLSASIGASSPAALLKKPFYAVGLILFIATALYHGALGLRVVIEDYVHCRGWKYFFIISVNFIAIVTAVATILATVYAHVGNAGGGKQCYRNQGMYQEGSNCPRHEKCCKKAKHKKGEHCDRKQKESEEAAPAPAAEPENRSDAAPTAQPNEAVNLPPTLNDLAPAAGNEPASEAAAAPSDKEAADDAAPANNEETTTQE